MTLVLVERILSDKPFGVIFAARTLDSAVVPEGSSVRVKAKRRFLGGAPAAGERWTVDGPLGDTRWGPQIEASSGRRMLPSGALLRTYLAEHLPGIGIERADRLWKAFGVDLPERLMEGDLGRLAEVMAPDRPTLGPRLAAAVVEHWRKASTEAELITWLQTRGVDDIRVARRVAAVFGDSAVERLGSNPWSLVTLLPWEKVDALGLRLKRDEGVTCPETLPVRLVGAADAVVKDVIGTGATVLPEDALRRGFAQKLGDGANKELITTAIDASFRNGAVVRLRSGVWRAPGCAMMEDAVAKRLSSMAGPSRLPAGFDIATALRRYEEVGNALHPEQRLAVSRIVGRRFSCLQGGAGVGKTHVTKAICSLWEDAGGDVVLATISGKAALRLSRATGRLAKTLFRLLRELDERSDRESKPRQDPFPEIGDEKDDRLSLLARIGARTLMVIDEASMVDLATMHGLLRRMPEDAGLLLIGDDRQLPPVSFGLVFHKLVDDSNVTERLTVIHRQTGASGIPAAAALLRARRMPRFTAYGGVLDGISLIPALDAAAIADGVLRACSDLAYEDVLVVAPTHEGVSGVRSLNRKLHDRSALPAGMPEVQGFLGEVFSVGDPIVHNRNDYKRGLFNGSLGRVLHVDLATGGLTAAFDDEEYAFGRDELIDLSLGYVLTCHRSQGSQAARIVVALTPSRLLDPSWVYTAVTRAEKQVVVVGDEAVLRKALGRPWAGDVRQVGFEWPSRTSPPARSKADASPELW